MPHWFVTREERAVNVLGFHFPAPRRGTVGVPTLRREKVNVLGFHVPIVRRGAVRPIAFRPPALRRGISLGFRTPNLRRSTVSVCAAVVLATGLATPLAHSLISPTAAHAQDGGGGDGGRG